MGVKRWEWRPAGQTSRETRKSPTACLQPRRNATVYCRPAMVLLCGLFQSKMNSVGTGLLEVSFLYDVLVTVDCTKRRGRASILATCSPSLLAHTHITSPFRDALLLVLHPQLCDGDPHVQVLAKLLEDRRHRMKAARNGRNVSRTEHKPLRRAHGR